VKLDVSFSDEILLALDRLMKNEIRDKILSPQGMFIKTIMHVFYSHSYRGSLIN